MKFSHFFIRRPIFASVLSLLIGIGPVLLRLAGLFPPNADPAVFGILFTTSIIGVTCGIIASTMATKRVRSVAFGSIASG